MGRRYASLGPSAIVGRHEDLRCIGLARHEGRFRLVLGQNPFRRQEVVVVKATSSMSPANGLLPNPDAAL